MKLNSPLVLLFACFCLLLTKVSTSTLCINIALLKGSAGPTLIPSNASSETNSELFTSYKSTLWEGRVSGEIYYYHLDSFDIWYLSTGRLPDRWSVPSYFKIRDDILTNNSKH